MRRSARLLATLAVGAGVIPLGAIGIAHAQSLELVSAASSAAPIPANDFSNQPGGVSADDRFAVFPSRASNLVADDSNGLFDVFVRDRTLGITERVSVSSDGTQSNGDSALDVDISGDGRFVVFASGATNLVAGDSNGRIDIFLHDRQLGTTVRLSQTNAGVAANADCTEPSISADGRFVAFTSAANNLVAGDVNSRIDIFRLELATGVLLIASSAGVTQGNDTSGIPSVSADGRFVLFLTASNNLFAGDTNGQQDAVRRDFSDGSVVRVGSNAAGEQLANASFLMPGNALSADGQRAAFTTFAAAVPADTNGIIDAYVRDLSAETTAMASPNAQDNGGFSATLSADGGRVCYLGFQAYGDELFQHLYVHDLSSAVTLDVMPTVRADSRTAECGPFSADGSAIYLENSADTGDARTSWNVARRVEITTGTTSTVSLPSVTTALLAGDGSARSLTLGLAEDGRTLAFASSASNLVANDTNQARDIFVRDVQTGITTRVSVDAAGNQADCRSNGARISGNGRFVAFHSCAALVAADSNDEDDVYLLDRQSMSMSLVSVGLGNAPANGRSHNASVADDGAVSYTSCASNLIAVDNNQVCDVFIKPLGGEVQRVQGAAEPNAASSRARLSRGGDFVVFDSLASNWVAGDTNVRRDVYLLTRSSAEITRISLQSSGSQVGGDSFAGEVTADGQRVSFISGSSFGSPTVPSGANGIYLRDRSANTTSLLTRTVGNVAFTGTVTDAGHRLSDDGRWLAFTSSASNALPAPANTSRRRALLRDNASGAMRNLSETAGGIDGNNNSIAIGMTSSGGAVVFDSFAGNLVADDLNGRIPDVFFIQLQAPVREDAIFADGFE